MHLKNFLQFLANSNQQKPFGDNKDMKKDKDDDDDLLIAGNNKNKEKEE